MTVTLKDIAESEKICEAVYPDWVEMQDAVNRKPAFMEAAPGITVGTPHNTEPIARFSGYLMPLEDNVAFVLHARTALPAMNKLVREMVEMVRALAMLACRANDPVACDGLDHCMPCQACRLVERMEEPSHD